MAPALFPRGNLPIKNPNPNPMIKNRNELIMSTID
jgi:hypothetical protein